MERCQVKDVLDAIAPNVEDAGVCITNAEGKARAIEALDLAMEALTKRIDSEGTLWWWAVPVCDGCFALPADCIEARQIFVNDIPTITRDQWFQGRLALGLRDCGMRCGPLEIIDMGEYAIPTPLPKVRPIRIALVAEFDSDANKEVVVEIVNEYGNRVKETLTLLAGQAPVTMEEPATDVTYVGKPQTDGPVKLYLSYDNGQRFKLAEYGPKVTTGGFRRKKLPRRFRGCNLIRIHGKMRQYRITSENDMLMICDRLALSFAVSAIADLRKRNLDGYNSNLTFSLNEINKGMENTDPTGNVSPVQFISGFGSNPSQAGNRRCWF